MCTRQLFHLPTFGTEQSLSVNFRSYKNLCSGYYHYFAAKLTIMMRTIKKLTLLLGFCGLVITFLYHFDFHGGQMHRTNPRGHLSARTVLDAEGSAPKVKMTHNADNTEAFQDRVERKKDSLHWQLRAQMDTELKRTASKTRRMSNSSTYTRKVVDVEKSTSYFVPLPPKVERTEAVVQNVRPCVRKDIEGSSSFVCVCNSTYCDQIATSTIGMLSTTYNVITSTKTGDRLTQRHYNFSEKANKTDDSITYSLKKRTILQAVLGFGGAFTDSATINIMKLSKPAQDKLIKSYFGTDGIEYSLGRIPMASCDFSTRSYSYDDYANDFELKNFSLAMEDTKYKIPIILRSLNESGIYVRLFGSPWSAPGWMKDSQQMKGKGRLVGDPGGKYYKTWANYFVKFLQEYARNGIDIWGLTVENEPSAGNFPGYSWQAMYFSSEMERDFIKMDLGPALKANGYSNVSLMILDDQRFMLPEWVNPILNDPEAASYVSGIGVHWYWDTFSPASVLNQTHANHPSKFLLGTEACAGSGMFEDAVILGSWERGEDYSHDIIEDLNHWVTGWVDWNMALDLQGGPNWVQNFVDSPIIVDTEHDLFYKQPMYYHLGHFSKFVSAGSWRIDYSTDKETSLESFIVQQADLSFVAVFLNRKDEPINIHIEDPLDSDRGVINAQVPARSIQTYHWKPSHTDRK
ncbi:lysosomal acid glucosylceramidase-like [Amphiura filiformis]|uniref:lysosomal acid glucosylceramidase-like n=1 Tax=Amphiura filiformis TaxID=82378 RepID=UPI003B20FDCB